MRLTQMHDTVAKVMVDWYGEQVECEVRPGRLTGDLIFAAEKADTEWAGLEKQVSAVVAGWDIVDEAGQQLPVNSETIATVPALFLGAVIRATVAEVSKQGRG